MSAGPSRPTRADEGGRTQGVFFVDGSEGIERLTARLTRERTWPEALPEDLALFTGRNPDIDAYRPGLAAFGLRRVETL